MKKTYICPKWSFLNIEPIKPLDKVFCQKEKSFTKNFGEFYETK